MWNACMYTYNKPCMRGVCMYIKIKNKFINIYWLQIHPKKLHQDNLTNIYLFIFHNHGGSKYNGINVHPIDINRIIFKFEIITRFTKPI